MSEKIPDTISSCTGAGAGAGILVRFDRLFVYCIWLFVALALLIMTHESIANAVFLDPDDALRMVQVRDLLAGQGWYDAIQHRINPPDGGMIHWSRFIDAQLAGAISLLQPIVGEAWAEHLVVTFYPLVLLLSVFLLLERLLAYFGGRGFVIFGLIVAATSAFGYALGYFRPLRIDHHGWQILLSLLVLLLAFGADSWKRGFLAAMALAVYLEISLEGLPYLAIFLVLFALDWVVDARQHRRLAGFAAGLVLWPLAWRLLWRGWEDSFSSYCDAFTLPYWGPTFVVGGAVATLVFAASRGGRLHHSRIYRLVGLAGIALVGALIFVWLGRDCLAGPFSGMDPIVRENWYNNIIEGVSINRLDRLQIIVLSVPTLLGVGAVLWVAWAERQGALGRAWLRLCFVTLCAAVVGIFLSRFNASVQLFLTPAYAYIGLAVWRWGRAQPSFLLRVFGPVAIIFAFPLCISVAVAWLTKPFASVKEKEAPDRDAIMQRACITKEYTMALAAQPETLLFIPLSLGPHLLLHTPHSVTVTSHHRNQEAIKRALVAFRAAPDEAERIIRRTDARYLVWCPNLNEMANAQRDAPDGLAAVLAEKRPLAWLRFEPHLSLGDSLRVYRILPADAMESSGAATTADTEEDVGEDATQG